MIPLFRLVDIFPNLRFGRSLYKEFVKPYFRLKWFVNVRLWTFANHGLMMATPPGFLNMGSTLRICTEVLSVCCATISGVFVMYKIFHQAKQRKSTSLIENGKEILPPEIISEILSYLDVKDLLRCKSVCKTWNTLIQDRRFRLREPKTSTYTIINRATALRSNLSLPYSIVLSRCNGLEWRMMVSKTFLSLLYSLMGMSPPPKWRKISYYITNRETHQILPLPNLLIDPDIILSYAFAHIPVTDQYKLATISENDNVTKCAVLTLGGSEHKWKYFDFPMPDYIMVIVAGANVHCISIVKIEERCVHELTTFDLGSECFTVTILDKDFLSCRVAHSIMDWNGSLSFVYMEREELIVFVLEDYKNIKFASKLLVPLTFLREEEYVNKVFKPVHFDCGLLILRSEDGDQIGYDIDSKRLTGRAATADGKKAVCVRSEVSTVIRLKGMRNYSLFDSLFIPRF